MFTVTKVNRKKTPTMNIILLDALTVKNKEITNYKHFTQNVKYKRHNHI